MQYFLYTSYSRESKKERKKKQVKPLDFDPPGRGLTIIESIWNSGTLPYLVANAYGLNFIKIKCIWIFRGARGYIWPAVHIFEFGWAIPVKSLVWKFGLDWLESEVC